ncbi:MAG: hypothetical protein AB1567_02655 [bacterium]
MKKVFFRLTCVLIFGLGCAKEPTTNQKLVNLDLKGQSYENPDKGFFIKLYPEYEKVAEGKEPIEKSIRAVCYAKGKITRFAAIFWERDVAYVHNEYKRAFENPENFQDAASLLIFEELGVLGKIIEVKKLNIKNVDAYYFQTKHKRFLTEFYRTRIEAFPKNRILQITIFFQNEKDELPKVAKMIESMKITPGTKPVEEDTHHHHH